MACDLVCASRVLLEERVARRDLMTLGDLQSKVRPTQLKHLQQECFGRNASGTEPEALLAGCLFALFAKGALAIYAAHSSQVEARRVYLRAPHCCVNARSMEDGYIVTKRFRTRKGSYSLHVVHRYLYVRLADVDKLLRQRRPSPAALNKAAKALVARALADGRRLTNKLFHRQLREEYGYWSVSGREIDRVLAEHKPESWRAPGRHQQVRRSRSSASRDTAA